MKPTSQHKNVIAVFAVACLALATAGQSFAQLTNGLVAYWPFDNAIGCNNATPDLIHGYNMRVIYGGGSAAGPSLTNFNSNIYLTNDAVRGQAVHVDNSGAVQMALAFISVNTNDLAPVNRYSPSSNTVSFWVKTDGNHPPANNDERMWTESDYIRTLASVLDFSAVGAGYDMFIRQTGPGGSSTNYGNFSGGTHTTGGGATNSTIADGNWHNFTIVTIPSSPGSNLTAILSTWVDGVQDTGFTFSKPDGLWKLDTVGLFALVRNGNAGFITNCTIDDLAEWSRPLSQLEIQDYMAHGITNAGSAVAPVTINQFSSDLYAVIQGSNVVLSWQASSDATGISIDHGVGSVLGLSSCGVGSTTVTVSSNTTYTLTVTRGTNTATQSLTVTTVTGVTLGWTYVGGFNELAVSNNLGNQGNWQSFFSSPQTFVYGPAYVLPTVGGNHVLGIGGTPVWSAASFGHNSIGINNAATLFFRFYLDPSINAVLSTNSSDPNFNVIPDEDVGIGVSDVALFDVVTFSASDKGPSLRIFRNQFGNGGPIDLTADWGAGSTTGFSWINSVDPNGLQTGVVYNVWMDITNMVNDPVANAANYYSVSVQIGGDHGTFTNLFTNQISDENTNHATKTLVELFLAANKAITPQATDAVLFDDFYLSSGGYLHTIPVPQGSFVVGVATVPSSITLNSVTRTGTSVSLGWNASPAGSYTYTVQSRSALNGGSWTTVATGITNNTYTVTGASASAGFYRVSSP